MKIAMIGHKRIPSREGGVEIVVEEISKRLVKKGFSVTAYNRNGNHVSGKQFNSQDINKKLKEYKGIKIVNVITINYKFLAAITSSFFGTIKAIFGKYDCIHYHAEGPCMMLIIPHIFGIRTIATIHGLDWKRNKWGKLAKWYLKTGEKVALKYSDEIIVLSKNVQDYFWKTYNRKTRLIHNGIERKTIVAPNFIRNNWGLNAGDYILFLGRIVPEKGIEYLVDAFKNVKTNKKLVIAGGSSDTKDFYDRIKEKSQNDKRIIFTDFVQGKVLEELFSNAYFYVLPSDLEGMPISLLEAMSYGNCCLVSDISECVEVVEDKGVYFNKGDVEDLRIKIQMLCDNNIIVQQKRSVASEFICSKYNWDDIVDKTILLYENKGDNYGNT